MSRPLKSWQQRFYESADDRAVRTGDWWFADIEGTTMPVRAADKNDRITWYIDGQKVAVIDLPEPGNEQQIDSWAYYIALGGKGWITFAIQVYNDRWTFSDGNPQCLQRLKVLEEVKNTLQV